METSEFLLEIGTEELPPKSLPAFIAYLQEAFKSGLTTAHIEFQQISTFATPRRLAVMVGGIAVKQMDQNVSRKGPAVKAAFNEQGEATPAALGFAKSCGVDVSALTRIQSDKGDYLVYQSVKPGEAAELILPDMVRNIISSLPVERRMKWGDTESEFVRPIHWVLMLLGDRQIEADLLGIHAGRLTFGHRFMAPGAIEIKHPRNYVASLRAAKVIACFEERREAIREQLKASAKSAKAKLLIDEALLDEVTALVEWPVVLTGKFHKDFLKVPEEALISAMSKHQRYFHLVNSKNKLMPLFLTVSNIASRKPEEVVAGNERVIRARLADARFFYDQDRKIKLDARIEALEKLIFQSTLGNYAEKSHRISALAGHFANEAGATKDVAERAGLLCKADLVSSMVDEFPDLQGIMGSYYALESGESSEVAEAIRDQYRPAFAGDSIPATAAGRWVALAEKIDTLTGLFGIGQPPSGSKDPYALRRAASGVVRIILEGGLPTDLLASLRRSAELYHPHQFDVKPVFDYLLDRLEHWYLEQGISNDVFKAVRNSHDSMSNLVRTDSKIRSLDRFRNTLQKAEQQKTGQLIEVNKRVANILKGIELSQIKDVDTKLFVNDAENALYTEVKKISGQIESLMVTDDFDGIFSHLASIQAGIDKYFEEVMVMCEDRKLQENRIATLATLRNLFLDVADLSLLQL